LPLEPPDMITPMHMEMVRKVSPDLAAEFSNLAYQLNQFDNIVQGQIYKIPPDPRNYEKIVAAQQEKVNNIASQIRQVQSYKGMEKGLGQAGQLPTVGLIQMMIENDPLGLKFEPETRGQQYVKDWSVKLPDSYRGTNYNGSKLNIATDNDNGHVLFTLTDPGKELAYSVRKMDLDEVRNVALKNPRILEQIIQAMREEAKQYSTETPEKRGWLGKKEQIPKLTDAIQIQPQSLSNAISSTPKTEAQPVPQEQEPQIKPKQKTAPSWHSFPAQIPPVSGGLD